MYLFNELSDAQRRILVDLRQIYEAWRESSRRFAAHYAGTMRWKRQGNAEYLVRTVGRAEKGLGRRSPETEAIYEAFTTGRQRIRTRLEEQAKALDLQAALARTAGLGRVPRLVARLLRVLDEARVLGHLRIVGTNALFAYEALAGVTVAADALATGDVDLLLDARRRLRIMVPDTAERTVAGLIRRADRSFEILSHRPYCMANDQGFMVDLIRPQPKPAWREEPGSRPLKPGDVEPVAIEGLQWLVNAPGLETVAVDDNGYPVPILVPDPRVWMAHKLWLSQRPDRDPVKMRRDAGQALLVCDLLRAYVPSYPLDDAFFAGLPGPLREAAAILCSSDPTGEDEEDLPSPAW